ncbi:MAG: hypothetical protein HY606_06115 [Planctomycetes bacterium]|nr:hypothetical protein [Planctomycetota bacterium]
MPKWQVVAFLAVSISVLSSNNSIIISQVQQQRHKVKKLPNWWAKSYSGDPNNDEVAKEIKQTTDNGYIVVGYTNSFDTTSTKGRKVWVIKTKQGSIGDLKWEYAYSNLCDPACTYVGNSIMQTSDNGYIIAGYTEFDVGAGSRDYLIIKIDDKGNLLWSNSYGLEGTDEANSIWETSDGGYVVAGSGSVGPGDKDFLIIKLDINGNKQWAKIYGGIDPDVAYSIQQTSDGGYIVAGSTTSFGSGLNDFWIIKLDQTGVINWQKALGTKNSNQLPNDDYALSIQQTKNGNYIVCGYIDFGSGLAAWVIQLASDGTVIWEKQFIQPLEIPIIALHSIKETSNNDIIAGGIIYDQGLYPPQTAIDFWGLRLDSLGTTKWEYQYGGLLIEQANSVAEELVNFQPLKSSGVMLTGSTTSFPPPGSINDEQFWLVKVSQKGKIIFNPVKNAFTKPTTTFGPIFIYTDIVTSTLPTELPLTTTSFTMVRITTTATIDKQAP